MEKVMVPGNWECGVGRTGTWFSLVVSGRLQWGKITPNQIFPASVLIPSLICLRPFPRSPFKTGTMLNVAKHSQVLKQNCLERNPMSAECFCGRSWRVSCSLLIKFSRVTGYGEGETYELKMSRADLGTEYRVGDRLKKEHELPVCRVEGYV